jgi:hypothetical protein
MSKHPGLILTALWLLLPFSAAAQVPAGQTPSPKPEIKQIAFLQLEANGVDKSVANIVTDAILAQLKKIPYSRVVGAKEVDTMLGYEQKKQMAGCSDTSCMIAIGGALGVDVLVIGSVGKIGSSYVFNLKLLNIREGSMEGMFDRRMKGGSEEDFLDLVPEAVATLFPAAVKTQKPASNPSVPSIQEQAPSEKSGSLKPAQVVPWVLLGTGLASIATGGVLHGLAVRDYGDYERMPENDPSLGSTWDGIYAKEVSAYVLYGVGTAMALGGVIWLLIPKKEDGAVSRYDLRFAPAGPGMIGGGVSGRW